MERREQGYYRCKHKHTKAYSQICKRYQPYITAASLTMLHHQWSTQTNEALNKSVSSYAPKDRTFCSTQSLATRVSIAAAVQIAGYHVFWTGVFRSLNLEVNDNLTAHLTQLDRSKEKRRIISATKEGKARRSKSRYEKLSHAHKQDMEAQKNGVHY